MPGFMNSELEKLRDSLLCGHCNAKFKGSDSQARKVKYEHRIVYCSGVCRSAGMSNKAQERAIEEGKKLRKGALIGPCKNCGQMFESRIDKMYCTLRCYIKSRQFREMQSQYWGPSTEIRKKMAESRKTGKDVPCLECGEVFYQKRSLNGRPVKKFCNQTCYRSFFAKRFDRWIANPESMALPQCYDEFLDREVLACVVEGCGWKGRHLTLHVNQSHGMKADEFKRATGFNLSTGVIARPLAEALRDREIIGVALMDADVRSSMQQLAQDALLKNPVRYRSLEGKEHALKSRAMLGHGPQRLCIGCGIDFQQSTPCGRALYCSPSCRDGVYAKRRKSQNCGHAL